MDKTLGIYIHIPFCASRCKYCDFCSSTGGAKRMPKYQDALLHHIRESAGQMAPYLVDTIYFGGGTPSFYGAKRIVELFNALKMHAQVLKSAEVTVECNPDSMTLSGLKAMRRAGVNRLSIGMQSANDDILKLIGRRHSFKQVERAVELARKAGFDNLSLDLIYGLPSQTPADWAETLSRALDLRPEHLSCYGLQLEAGTPLYEYKDSPFLPTDDEQADMYLYAVETLERFDYPQYEVSNFALKGFESRHNLKYWSMREYMGFGASAHSYVGGVRYGYVPDVQQYIDGVGSVPGVKLLAEYEKAGPLDRAAEYIMLGMRTTRGITADEYRAIYRSDFEPMEQLLQQFKKRGWAVEAEGRWRLTTTGFLISNTLIGALLEAQAQQKLSTAPWLAREETPEGE